MKEKLPETDSVEGVVMELRAASQDMQRMGAVDSEQEMINGLIARVQGGDISPQEARSELQKMWEGKQDYH